MSVARHVTSARVVCAEVCWPSQASRSCSERQCEIRRRIAERIFDLSLQCVSFRLVDDAVHTKGLPRRYACAAAEHVTTADAQRPDTTWGIAAPLAPVNPAIVTRAALPVLKPPTEIVTLKLVVL
jgi:hypothetical protein